MLHTFVLVASFVAPEACKPEQTPRSVKPELNLELQPTHVPASESVVPLTVLLARPSCQPLFAALDITSSVDLRNLTDDVGAACVEVVGTTARHAQLEVMVEEPRALLVRVSEVVRVSDQATHLTCTVTCTFTLTVTLDLSLSLTLTLTRPRPNLTLTSTVLQRCDIPNRQMAVPSSEPSQPSRVQPPAVVVLGHADTHVPGLSP